MPVHSNFYVYEHWRPDTNICFYVGKGCGDRAHRLDRRNRLHRKIQGILAVLGVAVDVRIVRDGMNSQEAFSLEKERMELWESQGVVLTNLRRCGYGRMAVTEEMRAKMRASQARRHERARELGLVIKRTPESRKKMSEAMRAARANKPPVIVSESTRLKLAMANRGKRRSPETIERLREAAKIRGISQVTREAQVRAITGRKRAPFTETTIARMRIAAAKREAAKRQLVESDGLRI